MGKSDLCFVGCVREVRTKFGVIIRVSFNKDDVQLLSENLNESGFVNLQLKRLRRVSEKGFTHSCTISNWKPEKGNDVFVEPPNSEIPQAERY